MTKTSPEIALERILTALEAELVAATDDEIAAALKALGLTAATKGSAARPDMRDSAAWRQLAALYGFEPPAAQETDENRMDRALPEGLLPVVRPARDS